MLHIVFTYLNSNFCKSSVDRLKMMLSLGELNQYVTNFQWDVAKYPLIKQTTLRNLAEIIGKVSTFIPHLHAFFYSFTQYFYCFLF
jgi:hypothetical protein